MNVIEKLEILADAAKYDVACTSSGVQRAGKAGQLGAATQAGCCHSFTPDGRCVTLLKVLMTNVCVYDCCYCVNRASNAEAPRAAFTPRELADLTIGFYRRNYIEGLFLSSGVAGCPDRTTELMIAALRILREEYGFRGYIHTKAIPGTSVELIDELGRLSDRLSVNLELPSRQSLGLLAPNKSRASILAPMRHICDSIADDAESRSLAKKRTTVYLTKKNARKARAFAPAGQSTQMIVGATPESDYQILNLSAALYTHLSLKRVNSAPLEALLRVPGIGVRGAKLICRARRQSTLGEAELRKLGIAYKRARYFITMNGAWGGSGIDFSREALHARLSAPIDGGRHGRRADRAPAGQMSLFETVEAPPVLPETSPDAATAREVAFAAQRRALETTGTADGRQAIATEAASATERSIADGRKTLDSPLLSVA